MSKSTTEFDRSIETIATECIALRMRMINRVISKLYDDALRPLGLKGSQMTILVAAQKVGIVRPNELAEHLQLDVSTLSRNAERMKTRGWLEVVPDEDGRAQPFRLTAKGRRLLESAIPKWLEAQQKAKQMLGQDAVDLVRSAADHVRHSENAE